MPEKGISHWKEYRAALSGEYIYTYLILHTFRLESVDFSAVNFVNILSGCQCGYGYMVSELCRRFTAFTEIPRKRFLPLATPYSYQSYHARETEDNLAINQYHIYVCWN